MFISLLEKRCLKSYSICYIVLFFIQRFCTIILTVSGEDQRVGPVLLFKGKGHISPIEQKEYADGVKVYFTPEGVINTPTMKNYSEWFISKVRHLYRF